MLRHIIMKKQLKELIERNIETVERVDWRSIGVELRKMREEKGKSLRLVAQQIGVSAPYLSDMERGNRNFNLNLVEKYLLILKKK